MDNSAILSLDEGILERNLKNVDGILALAEPWLVDSGLLKPAGTLSNEDSASRLRSVKKVIDSFLLEKEGFIGTVLCVKFNYCELKKHHSRRIDLVKATGDTLCAFLTGVPVPIILIAAYIVEEGYCDRLCKCA